jgi:hypothetical protein
MMNAIFIKLLNPYVTFILVAGFICGYKIVSRHNTPFVVELKDRTTGEAEVKVAENKRVDYEKRAQYKFSLIAYDCGSPARESER